jgi:flagellar basal-body rod protein FlgC
MSGIFSAFKITASGLTAQRLRMDVIAANVANAETTRTAEGGPYQRKVVVFSTQEPQKQIAPLAARFADQKPATSGVRVEAILSDESRGHRVYDPDHPDADADGFVTYPNVNVVTEMTDMLSATRSYEANVTVFNALKAMALKALDIGRNS